jgi:transposase
MKTMARHRSHSGAFKRQVAQGYLSGETLHGLAKHHDLSRNTLKTSLVNAPQPLRERFIGVTGTMPLIRASAAQRPGTPVSTTASAKMALQALAKRWLMLNAEINEYEAILETLVRAKAPALMEAPGVSIGTVADMPVVLGDNPHRIRSETAFAKLCGVCLVPASSSKTSRHCLNRGGNRRANTALYRVALVRMPHHSPTREYIQR